MRILFMGTPAFAAASLKALVEAGHSVCGVFSQPDRPVGRHQNHLQPTPVKEYALTKDIPVFQPTKLRDGAALALIQELQPELIVVAAYGRILPDEILAYPPKGCINVHSSLLPKYRGAAPINWAILNGEKETGVTIMHMASELDAGDIIAQCHTAISENENAQELYDRLAILGGELLVKVVSQIEEGRAPRRSQDESQVSLAPLLSKELSPIDWNRSAQQIHDQVRGLIPWPAATMQLGGKRCKVFSTVIEKDITAASPGAILAAGNAGIKVACGDGGVLTILELQADGSRRMSAADFLRGNVVTVE